MALHTLTAPIELGHRIASAAEGVVSEVRGRPDTVVKVFHGLGTAPIVQGTSQFDPLERVRKVAVMIDSPPAHRVQPDGHVVLTWPEELVLEDGIPVGYTMARIDWTRVVELGQLVKFKQGDRAPAHIPAWVTKFPLDYRVHTAINLCRAVAVVHSSSGAVIGDFNDRNVLVDDSARVTLVDADSMQFLAPDGHLFPCDVGHRDYLAPELLYRDLAETRRTRSSDLFSLAIHIHRLLLGGMHPFLGGEWIGEGPRKTTLALARVGQYVDGPSSPLVHGPTEPDPATLPANVRELFDRAFRFGAHRPLDRPSASHWARELKTMLPPRG